MQKLVGHELYRELIKQDCRNQLFRLHRVEERVQGDR
jgi:hypothetical protein